MNRLYAYNHAPISFYFKQSANDFVVDEIPLYPFSGEGEHLVLHVRKKNLSTHELIEIFAKYLGIKQKEIGYAGLKDKHALTYQYISLHKKYENQIEQFAHPQVKILDTTYHNNKIRMGHLKGNKFFIRVKKVNPTDAKKIDEVLTYIQNYGMPNFFGYQRFGTDGDNHILGEEIAKGKRKERNPKIRRLLVNAYQSHLFNLWLSKRIETGKLIESFQINELVSLLNLPKDEVKHLKEQKHPFKVMLGDVMQHYPYGRLFWYEHSQEDLQRFFNRDISVTGLLCGKKVKHADGYAREIEKSFDEEIPIDGGRRYAWIFPEEISGKYIENEAWYEFGFMLPKGSYATVFLEEIAKQEIKDKN